MKTSIELSKFTILIEENEAGVVQISVSKDGAEVDNMTFDANEYEDATTPKDTEEEEEETTAVATGDTDATPEVETEEVEVSECLTFDKYFEKKEKKA